MRAMRLTGATLAASLAVSFGAQASGGAYASLPARDPAACARLCADDGLCIAWSFQSANICELRATAPQAPDGIAHGLSRRAPDGRRQPQAVDTPPIVAAAEATLSGGAPPADVEEDMVDQMLLGGLAVDTTGLRN